MKTQDILKVREALKQISTHAVNMSKAQSIATAALALIDEAQSEKVEPVGVVESAVVGAGGFHVCLADGVAMPKVGDSLYAAQPAPAQQEFPVNWAWMIHYPDCWDTAAYPTLRDAIHEALAWSGCSVCKPQHCQCPACQDGPHDSDCAVHNMPACKNGPCDCKRAAPVNAKLLEACKTIRAWARNWDSEFMNDPDWIESDGPMVDDAIAQAEGKV